VKSPRAALRVLHLWMSSYTCNTAKPWHSLLYIPQFCI